ncbi:leucine-rich repeat-containing protein 15-like [Belonocnema kinseyi]|uniref:leucine-rich repeat-containing protein 15-like n=1 Tax=Belonocnema kinseyi TaxID=2817044 RepID=UPI00143DF82E|nr:leucine-rich repeat-containing protein 15-like [Belonocnema kinseyi]
MFNYKVLFVLYSLLLFTIMTKCIALSELSTEDGNIDKDDYNCNNQSITLNFKNIVLSNIGSTFIASPLISCLNLQGNGISTISPHAFDELPNLSYLNLTDNTWNGQQMLYNGGHKSLKTLILNDVLSWYDMQTSKSSMHINASYPALEKLFLRNNRLNEITGSNEANFPKLLYLDLSHNRIRTFGIHRRYGISNNDFSWLPKSLKYLQLDNNLLVSLSLTNMNELEFLSINNNQLESILLQNLDKLQKLSTTGNMLESMILKNLNGLKKISAKDNKLKVLSYNSFQGIPQLEDLNLANNQISDFDGRIVDFIPKLQNLILENNLLTDVPVIRDAPCLQLYSLRCNKISKLGSNNFNNMPNLKFLDLDNNVIDKINSDTFSHLAKLETLSLGRNSLSILPAQWMIKLQNLRYLNLEENFFTNIEALELNDSPSLMQLFLQNNPLKYLRAHSLDLVPANVTIELDKSLSAMSECKNNTDDRGYLYSERIYNFY